MQGDGAHVEEVRLSGFRGLRGRVRLARGLTILLGPNMSGKTALLEALALTMAANHGDAREHLWLYLLVHDARGSTRHSIAGMAPEGEERVEACVSISGGRESCIGVERSEYIESGPRNYQRVLGVTLKATSRECSVQYEVRKTGVNVRLVGGECMGGGYRVGLLPPGIIPYNFVDVHLSDLKRRSPEKLASLRIEVAGKQLGVDVSGDEWGELSTYIVMDGDDGEQRRLVNFYTVGRGVQRLIQSWILLETKDLVLIDEVESAMHPELLVQLARLVAERARSGVQIVVASQSVEATLALAASYMLRGELSHPSEAFELAREGCRDEDGKGFAITILNRVDSALHSLPIYGCDALSHIVGTSDPRLTYKALRGHVQWRRRKRPG